MPYPKLEDAHRREETITIEGGDLSLVRNEILDLRRKIREGGTLKPGDLLAGRFKLVEPLGRGGFATVWRAFDQRLRSLVAVKVLHGHFAEDRTRRERFFRGARKMAELSHPGIVRVIEQQLEDGGFHFFVMELVTGGDLRQAVLEKRLRPESICPLLQQVAEALQFAHDHSVFHRDVKPANILLDAEGKPKLTDFDLVRAVDTTGGTLGGGVLGTFLYTAPEAMSAPEESGAAADVYSLAMTAVFCFHGAELPYEILRNANAFLDKLPCPPGVLAAVRRGLAWEASERFSTVMDLAEALEWGLTAPVNEETRQSIQGSDFKVLESFGWKVEQAGSAEARLLQHVEGTILILSLTGRLDRTAVPEIERQIIELFKRPETRWVVDLSGLEHVSSAGLRLLLTLAKKLTARSGRLVLCSPSKVVGEILLISGLNPQPDLSDRPDTRSRLALRLTKSPMIWPTVLPARTATNRGPFRI